jgi:peptidyl-prolyl cis-trans isomerase B (cyclophilin B)
MGMVRLRPILIALALTALGCGERTSSQPEAAAPADSVTAPTAATAPAAPPAVVAPAAEPAKPHPVVALEVEGMGRIRIELLPEKASATAANFLDLAQKGFYDGTTFHRVIPGFMIQSGDPNSKNRDPRDDGQGGPGYTIADEFGDLKHQRGIVSMANAGRPNSGGSQFFIVVADQPDLDGSYSAFGRVIEGMDVVDAIAAVEVDKYGRWGPQDRPRTNVVIKSARVEEMPAAEGAASAPAAPKADAPAR